MSMRRRGPREWSPRPWVPDLEDLDEIQDLWEGMRSELTGILHRMEDLTHQTYKARRWMMGEGNFSKEDAQMLIAAAGSVKERLKSAIHGKEELVEVTKELGKWLIKVEKESRS